MIRVDFKTGDILMKGVYRPDNSTPALTKKLNETNLKIGDLLSETASINSYPDR